MTYRECFLWGAERLKEAQISEAELDARLLLEHVCQTDRNTLLVHGDRLLTDEEKGVYEDCIIRRAKRIPLQHITGCQEFMGLDFIVNEHTLIPRQDTEILVEEAMTNLHDGMRILDMCTGSGCILLSLLHYSNDCTGMGVDISKKALLVAGENAKRLSLDEQVVFVESDLFTHVEGVFDMIVSNPPYIRTKTIEELMPEVRDHEPINALDGMEDGLFFYKKITEEAADYLCGGGTLLFEIGFDQADEVKGLMERAGYRNVTVKKDYAGLDRVVFGQKGIMNNV